MVSSTSTIHPVSARTWRWLRSCSLQILFEFESFAGERTSDFALLNALGVLQLLFAQADDLAMVEPQGSDADEQQSAQHNPEDAQASVRKLLEGVSYRHRDFRIKIMVKRDVAYNGTKVLGLADKPQTCWHLRTSAGR